MPEESINKPTNFIRNIIDADLEEGKNDGLVHTRFPPEPNGYLHIGHAKSICLNFGLAKDYKGLCNLRFDDTNPQKEDEEFVEAIKEDVRWLGFDWGDRQFFASDYFSQLYDFAIQLIKQGDAYVCDLNAEQMRDYRGTLTEPGKDSPYRDRSVDENLQLFAAMKAGEFADGTRSLRAKIDMASPNINLRDPTIYRIRRDVEHHQTGNDWCIYPMYDYTHCLSDALEGITHSVCTLEFEDHRPLYNWYLETLGSACHPQQIEFSRGNLQYAVTSKRKLKQLVDEGLVEGWDDPRMATISGLRRRGYTAASIREFWSRAGVTKSDNSIEMSSLESCIREDLNETAPRAMAVLNPLKVVITNYPEGELENLTAPKHPQNEMMGSRTLPFTREIYIDREDFREQANNKFKRLVKDKEVRLRNAYVIRCDEVIKDANDEIIELHCSYDPATLGTAPEGRKVKGVIHWVSASEGIKADVHLYDRLFNHPHPDSDKDVDNFLVHLNPNSLTVVTDCILEPSLAQASAGDRFQFEREGYFCLDHQTSEGGKKIFNRTVTLRDTWAKIEQQLKA